MAFIILCDKLNKYMINIINEYSILNISKLIENMPKTRESNCIDLNHVFTIEDVIVRAINKGYKGFYIPCLLVYLRENITKLLNENIKVEISGNGNILYSFKNDNRDLFFINIYEMENIITRTFEIIDN